MAEAILKLRSNMLTRPELEELTEHFLPLAKSIASKFSWRGCKDDYIMAAYEGVEYALRTAPKKLYDDNLDIWVKSCIYRHIRRHRVTNHLVCIPNTTLRDARIRGQRLECLKSQTLLDNDAVTDQSVRYQELVDKIEQSATDDVDLLIIELRLEGYSDQEISERLGKSNSDIHRRRKRIEDTFNQLMRKKPCE